MKFFSQIFKDNFIDNIKDIFAIFGKLFLASIAISIVLVVLFRFGQCIYDSAKETKSEKCLSRDDWPNVIEVHNSDYNVAELLARKRADYQYGVGQYVFTSTNLAQKVFWKVEKK